MFEVTQHMSAVRSCWLIFLTNLLLTTNRGLQEFSVWVEG